MRNPLRALIVDDELPARRLLRKLLAAHPELAVVGDARNVVEGIDSANRLRPDVIFLDIQMPPQSGFDLLAGLEFQPQIVFVTAHDEFAIRAFDANAFDYLLKPVDPERLAESVRRLMAPLPERNGTHSSETLTMEDLVPLREQRKLRMVAVADIAAIRAEGPYSHVVLKNLPPMMVLRSSSEWERILPRPPFARLDRSLIVNLSRIGSVQIMSRNASQVELVEVSEKLVLGRTASARLRRYFAF